MNETDPWGIAPGVFWVKEELLQHGKYCHYLPDTLCERIFGEYSGQNILVANKDTFLDKQGSYLLMNIIVL